MSIELDIARGLDLVTRAGLTPAGILLGSVAARALLGTREAWSGRKLTTYQGLPVFRADNQPSDFVGIVVEVKP